MLFLSSTYSRNISHVRNFRNNLLMIYKNRSFPWIVLSLRFFLDYAAAAMFLATGKKGSAKAVYEARKEYKRMRKNYK